MQTYKTLKNNSFQLNGYTVLPLREQDIYKIKDWRNEQMHVLRQKQLLSDENQKTYYEKYVIPTFGEEEPKIMLFSFMDNQEICIGYGGLTNISWLDKRAEISFLLNTSRTKNEDTYKNDFSAFLNLMKLISFRELQFNRLFTETYDIRPLHISILESSGFVLEGRMKEHVFINGKFVDSLIHGYLKSYYES